MNVLKWLRGRLSQRRRAAWLYQRGMDRANAHLHEDAIEDYSMVVEMEAAPRIRAMALYNRALVYSATHRETAAMADLRAVLAMPRAPEEVKREARRKLLRMDRNADRTTAQESETR